MDWADHNIYGDDPIGLDPAFPKEMEMIDIVDQAIKSMRE